MFGVCISATSEKWETWKTGVQCPSPSSPHRSGGMQDRGNALYSGNEGATPFTRGMKGQRPLLGEWRGNALFSGAEGATPFSRGLKGQRPFLGEWKGNALFSGVEGATPFSRGLKGQRPFLGGQRPFLGGWKDNALFSGVEGATPPPHTHTHPPRAKRRRKSKCVVNWCPPIKFESLTLSLCRFLTKRRLYGLFSGWFWISFPFS